MSADRQHASSHSQTSNTSRSTSLPSHSALSGRTSPHRPHKHKQRSQQQQASTDQTELPRSPASHHNCCPTNTCVCCPYKHVDYDQGQGYGLLCCNYPCCPSSSSLRVQTAHDRVIVSGYTPTNLPPLMVTCFSSVIPLLPCLLLYNMNVWAWEFDLENDVESGGSALVMYERRKGICCEEKRLLINSVTKVSVEEIEEMDSRTNQKCCKARLTVTGTHGQQYLPSFSEKHSAKELQDVVETISLLIPPQFHIGKQLNDDISVLSGATGLNSSSVRPYQPIHSSPSTSSPSKSVCSQGSAAVHPLSQQPLPVMPPLHDITEDTVEDCEAGDESSQYQPSIQKKPSSQNIPAPQNRYFASAAVVADMKTVIPLKELVDMIRKELQLESGLVMAAIIAQGNASLGISSTGNMKEDAFRIATALGLIDEDG